MRAQYISSELLRRQACIECLSLTYKRPKGLYLLKSYKLLSCQSSCHHGKDMHNAAFMTSALRPLQSIFDSSHALALPLEVTLTQNRHKVKPFYAFRLNELHKPNSKVSDLSTSDTCISFFNRKTDHKVPCDSCLRVRLLSLIKCQVAGLSSLLDGCFDLPSSRIDRFKKGSCILAAPRQIYLLSSRKIVVCPLVSMSHVD